MAIEKLPIIKITLAASPNLMKMRRQGKRHQSS
jgi:hypothetical protein